MTMRLQLDLDITASYASYDCTEHSISVQRNPTYARNYLQPLAGPKLPLSMPSPVAPCTRFRGVEMAASHLSAPLPLASQARCELGSPPGLAHTDCMNGVDDSRSAA